MCARRFTLDSDAKTNENYFAAVFRRRFIFFFLLRSALHFSTVHKATNLLRVFILYLALSKSRKVFSGKLLMALWVEKVFLFLFLRVVIEASECDGDRKEARKVYGRKAIAKWFFV